MDILITVLLVLFATVMMVLEVVFIPGFGFTGVLGMLSMIGSVFYAFVQLGSVAGWITLLVVVMVCISLFLWALYGNSLDKMALKKNIVSKVNEQDVAMFAVGDRGVTRTRLALIGEALIKDKVVEVKSESGFINENEEIEIVRISGDSLFVAKTGNKK
ncbi:MAG: nodulation efficiency protein D (NfeD) [Bacteroidaceae bacterium]|jgi:membrane-bound ClpP family serine protease|nr:nodulation efficiency protein D (NfeD) [Bacteroidaceae bacterium]